MSWFNDTFTEASTTALTSHTSDSGHTWSAFYLEPTVGSVPNVYSSLGGVVGSGATGAASAYRESLIAPSADVTVSATFYYDSVNFFQIGVGARLNSTGDGGYFAYYSQTATRWEIARITGAALAGTLLANSSTTTYVNGNTPSIDFTVTGSGATVTLDLKVGGVTVASYSDTNAGRWTAAGYVGVLIYTSAAQGMFIGSMSATSPASNTAIDPPVNALTLTGYAPSVARTGVSISLTPPVLALALTSYLPTVTRTAVGTLTFTEPLKNNTGTVLANETGVTVYIWDPTTGALVLLKTGATTNSLGVLSTIVDPAIVGGTNYVVDPVTVSHGRRLRVFTAT